MATIKVFPGPVRGTLKVPPSKSHTMRAILFASMAKGKSRIRNYLRSKDTLSMIEAMRLFGVKIEVLEKELLITGVDGRLNAAQDVIHSGNSGQVFRFCAAFASLLPSYTIFTGDKSIREQRPIKPLLSAINQLQGFATFANLEKSGPIIVKGSIYPGQAALDGQDSQPVSALLMATSFLEGKTLLEVNEPGEKPWIDLTLHWIRKMGGKVSHQTYERYEIEGSLKVASFDYEVPIDFSSLSFPLAAALITQSSLTIDKVEMDDIQGDKIFISILKEMGAKIEMEGKKLHVLPSTLKGKTIDVNLCIDMIPILAVLGCFSEGETRLINGKIGRKKESDRLSTIVSELKKMGADIQEEEEGLIVKKSSIKGSEMKSFHDHRIAMSLSVAALGAKGESVIHDVGCIEKSYPTFTSDFQSIKGQMENA